jgi:small-conductance mechanosensitive channel
VHTSRPADDQLFTSFLGTISLILVLAAFATAHRRLGRDGIERHYGPAFAMVIVAWLMYLAAVPFVIIGWFAIRRARRDGVVETKTTTKRRFW